ncbi:hypothetical protein LAZ67_2005786 [Cordylochernes scorpioides]|uniref:Peptidase C1A papain C-terminal domain-containing protein n=1 Tax=Cordylochernes scorpioides TaxID=51811 RepID=A0ABY6K4P9_9ARAC|nr:hypothetical protein LAZ67_2005786 [Cordylochernes scorpioides]
MPFGFNLANTTSPRERQSIFVPPSDMEVPDEVDWTKEGLVTHVKNQWLCGSCWAFSATGALEGQVKKATGQLISLSVQQLIDCDKHDKGCHGGLMDSAYDYIKEAGGIESSDDYSYWSMHLWCRHKKRLDVAHVKGYTWIPEGDEEALKKAVATIGPIAVALNAKMELQYYRSGVYSSSHCPGDRESLNHGVLIVGYGEENGVPYWLIKNSWGKWWGQRGYMKLKRNVNMCGIANYALYPLV